MSSAANKMEGAAYLHIPTKRVFGPLDTHADFYYSDEMEDFLKTSGMDETSEKLWDLIDTEEMVDGFVDTEGAFYDRQEAAKAIKLDPAKGEPTAGTDRDWLDAMDLECVDGTIVAPRM